MDPYVIAITVVALLVAGRVVWELVRTLSRAAPGLGPDFDALGPDAGLWPGLFAHQAG